MGRACSIEFQAPSLHSCVPLAVLQGGEKGAVPGEGRNAPSPALSAFSSPLFIEEERKKKSQLKPVACAPLEARSASQTNKYIEQSSGRTGQAAAGAEAAAASGALGSLLIFA